MDPKNSGPNGRFVMTKKALLRHGFYLCRPALIVACSFLSRHTFMFSSLIMSRHNFTLSRHSSVDVFWFMLRHGCLFSRHKFPPPALQLFCNSLCYTTTLFLLLFSISIVTYFFFVAIVFLIVAWICYRDRIFLCRDIILLPYIT